MSSTPIVSYINAALGGSTQNISVMVGYIAGDASIVYADSSGNFRKFSVVSKTLVLSRSAGIGGNSRFSKPDLDEFILIDVGNLFFQKWDGDTLTKTHDYWSTFSGSIAAQHGNVVWSHDLDSVWTIEGAGGGPYSLVHYRLGAATRTVVSGVSLGAGQLALDAVNGRIFWSDGTNLGVANTSTDVGISSVAWSTIATCGAAFDSLTVDPDGFPWATCQGNNNSGHLWKINPVSLAALGQVGHHNNFLNIHPDATGIPVGRAQFAFGIFGITQYIFVAADFFWESALVDRDAVTISWNTATIPPILLNGSDLFCYTLGTCGITASPFALWSLVNDGGSNTTLAITEIGVAFGAETVIGHGANLNAYDNGGALAPTFPPGNGVLIKDLSALNNWARANGISVALCQDSQRTAKDMLDELLTVGNSAPVYSGDELKIIPYDEVSAVGAGAIYIAPTASGPVADLTDKDFVSDGKTPPVQFTRKRRASCDNVVAIEHIDRTLDYAHNVTTAVDQVSVAVNGPRKGGTLDASDLGLNVPSGAKSFLSIHSAAVAQAIASILAKRGAAGVNEYTFTLKAEWAMVLEAMDLVTLTDSRLGLNKVPVRITSAKEDAKRQIQCTAEAFVYGLNHPDVKNTTAATGTLVQVNVDPGLVNTPIIFEPPIGALPAGAGPQVWIVVSGADQNYGGCIANASVDGGSTYNPLGNIGPATTGVLTSTFASGTDPDTTHTLAVDLTESNGSLSTQSQQIADGFADPCFVESASGFELVCPTVATLTSAEHYSLATYIRRGVFGTTIVSHASAKRFAVLDGAVFKIDLPAQWIGKTIHLKFQAYNKLGGQLNQLSACVDYTFTPVAVSLPGGFYVNGS